MTAGQPVVISQPAVYSSQAPVIANNQILVASHPQVVTTQPLVTVTQPQVVYSTLGSQAINPALVQLNQPVMRSKYNVAGSGSLPGTLSNPAVLSQAINSSSGPFVASTNSGQANLQRPTSIMDGLTTAIGSGKALDSRQNANSYLDSNIANIANRQNSVYA